MLPGQVTAEREHDPGQTEQDDQAADQQAAVFERGEIGLRGRLQLRIRGNVAFGDEQVDVVDHQVDAVVGLLEHLRGQIFYDLLVQIGRFEDRPSQQQRRRGYGAEHGCHVTVVGRQRQQFFVIASLLRAPQTGVIGKQAEAQDNDEKC